MAPSSAGGGYDGTILAGNDNQGNAAAIVGGLANSISPSASNSFIGGGANNTNNGLMAAICGGKFNYTSGSYATVPGGYDDAAVGDFSFAAGEFAAANHNNSFVWGDGSAATGDTAANQFVARATGGFYFYPNNGNSNVVIDTSGDMDFGFQTRQMLNLNGALYGIGIQGSTEYFRTGGEFDWYLGGVHNDGQGNAGGGTTLMRLDGVGNLTVAGTLTQNSDRNVKTNLVAVDPQSVLEKLAGIPMMKWTYKTEGPGIRHLGPTAQDFHEAFGLNGSDDKHITTVDESGVALAAIQGLNQKLEQENAELKSRLEKLEQLVVKLSNAGTK